MVDIHSIVAYNESSNEQMELEMFITVNGRDNGAPIIINTANIIGIVDDGEGNVYVQMTGDSPAFKIEETIDQMEKLLSVANM